jgi:hypothetical protein
MLSTSSKEANPPFSREISSQPRCAIKESTIGNFDRAVIRDSLAIARESMIMYSQTFIYPYILFGSELLSDAGNYIFPRLFGLGELSEKFPQDSNIVARETHIFNDALDESQQEAVIQCDKNHPVTLIHGPPG